MRSSAGQTMLLPHISTRQYARPVDEWVTGMGLPSADDDHRPRLPQSLPRDCPEGTLPRACSMHMAVP